MSQRKKHSAGPQTWTKALRLGAAATLFSAVSLLGGLGTARLERVWSKPGNANSAQVAAPAALPARLSDPQSGNNRDDLDLLAPQEQAERLLERAINRSEVSLDMILQRVEGWRGRLQSTDHLFELVVRALASSDLRVRSAAIEIDLVANNLSKSPQSVARLVNRLRNEPETRSITLWRLGALGNRGVEPETVLATLLSYAHSRNANTRYWAIEGLAMLGSDAAVAPVLEAFAHDASWRVRQRAASSLAESGMFTKEQRLEAVPDLLNFLDDDALDSGTRGLVYAALRIITGEALGNDANAWREWWAHPDRARGQAARRSDLLRT